MRHMSPGIRWSIFILFAIGAAFWLSPVNIPYVVESYGVIYPTRQLWILKNNDGSLFTTVRNYSSGDLRSYQVSQVERGSQIRYHLADKISAGTIVQPGDTIATFNSSEIQLHLQELKAQHANVQAELKMRRVGSKKQLVEQARNEMKQRKELADLNQRRFIRSKKLYDRGLISDQYIDSLRSRTEVSHLGWLAARNRVESLESGEKTETLNWLKTRASGLQRQIDLLEHQIKHYTITSPFTGRINPAVSTDSLLSVTDTSRVIMMAVPWSRSEEIVKGRRVEIKIPMRDTVIKATILKLGDEAQSIDNQTYVPAWARINGKQAWLPIGLKVHCSIHNGKQTLWAMVRSFVNRALFM